MGFLRRKDERAMPTPGSKEFEEAVGASAPPTAGEPATPPASDEPTPEPERPEATIDEQRDAAEEPGAEEPSEADQPARGKRVLGALGRSVLKPPNAEGFGGGIPGAKKKR